MAWRDNWLGYVVGVLAVAIFMAVWLDTRSDIERAEQARENIPAETRR
jgi:hypothetical protein